jgi:hypothetical protein
VNRSRIIAQHFEAMAEADLARGRLLLAEVDALLAALERRAQDEASGSYDGWLPPQDRYQEPTP